MSANSLFTFFTLSDISAIYQILNAGQLSPTANHLLNCTTCRQLYNCDFCHRPFPGEYGVHGRKRLYRGDKLDVFQILLLLHQPKLKRKHQPKLKIIHQPKLKIIHQPKLKRIHQPKLKRIHQPKLIHSKSNSVCGIRFFSLQNSAEKVHKSRQQNFATKVQNHKNYKNLVSMRYFC